MTVMKIDPLNSSTELRGSEGRGWDGWEWEGKVFVGWVPPGPGWRAKCDFGDNGGKLMKVSCWSEARFVKLDGDHFQL